MGFFFQATQEQVQNSRGERVISVPATEGLHIHTYVRTYVQFGMVGLGHGGWPGVFWTFFLAYISFSLSLSARRPRYTQKYCLKGPLNSRQRTTSCLFHCLSVCLPVCMIVCLLVHGCCLYFCFPFSSCLPFCLSACS